jgi:hypothetical protein
MKPDRVQLLTQIRRATIDDQLAVLAWLQVKFGKIQAGSESMTKNNQQE